MTIFSCNNLSKEYDHGLLFEGVSFGMTRGDRIGLIGKNGIGKTTLLNIIAGMDDPDSGEVVFNKEARFEYLNQKPVFDFNETILDAVMSAKKELYNKIIEYNSLCNQMDSENPKTADRIEKLTRDIDNANGWNLESEAKIILSKLGIYDYYENVRNLSGGFVKRVALAKALISEPDLLILDEPTNHLDADSVQWLQDRLQEANTSILFVTHDRYFLDSVSTKIVELDQKKIFLYPGNYEKYLELKESFVDAHNAAVEHRQSKLREELAWLQRGARARRTKQKSRIDWIDKLEKEAKAIEERKIKIELGKTFMGSRIIDGHNLTKSIGGKLLFNDYTYIAKPGDRIGIIGPNGSGKSTFLNVLSGRIKPDAGTLKTGPSIKIGYFTQDSSELKPMQSVIGSLREIADWIDCGVGRDRYITAKELLLRFLFPNHQHSSLISTLSGGEKRRLGILRVLMANPNVIFLDEPTNDLDIQTLNSLERYLEDFYGTLLVVSHDRAFLDRTVDFIWAFDNKGGIKEYPGNYSAYLEKTEENRKQQIVEKKGSEPKKWKKPETTKKKLSYMEQREFDSLEKEIPLMEKQKEELEEFISKMDVREYKKIEVKSTELAELENKIEESTMRWLDLSDSVE